MWQGLLTCCPWSRSGITTQQPSTLLRELSARAPPAPRVCRNNRIARPASRAVPSYASRSSVDRERMMQTPSQRPMQAAPSVVRQLRFVGQPVLRTGGSGETGCGQVISQATGFWLRGAVCLNYTIMDDVAAVATGRTIERTRLRMAVGCVAEERRRR